MPAKPSKSKFEKLLELIKQEKHNLALRELGKVKKKITIVKKLDIDYRIEDKEKFMQVIVPSEGRYLLWLIVKKDRKIMHRFYLKQSSKKRKGNSEYNVISWRIPAELRGSKIRLRVCRLEE
ncbi:hypothetical protein Igag_1979 [Ignisphaera aggregans DSM 17230]|uniref:Uncharacterized protein n=1 Tax=Ignisphaera aggregans (strain DSM 17230 / JCM 13409 / AQ1.S1) TaxID=583356 RepID=E0STI5_IGNAA|nr:hypothetical protein Igag_1979 [Ignisphaera aggregans DSM 17230]